MALKSFKSFKCKRCKKYLSLLSSVFKKKGVVFSLLSALFLTIACYFMNNLPVLTGESVLQYQIIQQLCDIFGKHQEVDYGNNVVYYNTSYDQITVPAIDYHGSIYPDTIGVNVITNRKKLADFLDLLEKADKYSFVIVDLAFDENDVSPDDSYLYDKILGMRDIVVANGDRFRLTPKLKGQNKDALVSYYVTLASTNLGRYEYSEKDKRSIPLFVYESLYPDKVMKRYGFGRFSLYFSGGKLCQNSNFLTFDDYLSVESDNDINDDLDYSYEELPYDNIGQILNSADSIEAIIENVASRTDSAIVIIGDIKNDIHDTYMGEKPGPLIMARALQTLREGKHIVSFWNSIIWFFIFFMISLVIYIDKPVSMYFPVIKKIPYKFVHLLLSLLSYSVVLLLCSFIEYAYFDRVTSLVIPIIYFSILKLVIQYRKLDAI